MLPDSIQSIGNYAFQNRSRIATFSTGSGCKSIGSYALNNCKLLANLTLGSNLEIIGAGAFAGCVKLTSLSLPNKVNTINQQAFLGCTALTSVYLPSLVETIVASTYGDSPFNNCTSNLMINCQRASKPTSWGTYWNYYSETGQLNINWNVA